VVELRFSSADYAKLPLAIRSGLRLDNPSTLLLEVFPVEHRLSDAFVAYDTRLAADKAQPAVEELRQAFASGSWLVLLLLTAGERAPILWTTVRRRTPARERQLMAARGQEVIIALPGRAVRRERRGPLVKAFPPSAQVVCPGFFELVLSNGCRYRCGFCYLRGTLRGQRHINLYTNPWPQVRAQIEAAGPGVFNTGELGDSLAVRPPLLVNCIEHFRGQPYQTLLLVSKGGLAEVDALLHLRPTPRVVVSFSVNTCESSRLFEHGAPPAGERLEAAEALIEAGWRVRLRLDPLVMWRPRQERLALAQAVAALGPERVTLGSLRPYRAVAGQMEPPELRRHLEPAPDGRLRYPAAARAEMYGEMAQALGGNTVVALCKEPQEVWELAGLTYNGCNCTE